MKSPWVISGRSLLGRVQAVLEKADLVALSFPVYRQGKLA